MKQLSPGYTSPNLRVFFACLLSFNIFITPIAAIAATIKPEIKSQKSESKTDKAAADDVFTKPLGEKSSLPAPRAEAAPQPLAPLPAAPPVGSVTASLTASLLAANGGIDADTDGKADPGDTIAYTLSLSNTSGAGATGLAIANPLDSHTTLVPGSLNSTPVAFDQSVSLNEDGTLVITLQGQDPDGSNVTFKKSDGSAFPSNPTTIATAHGTIGNFGSLTCDANGVCSQQVTYTPAADYNGSDSFSFKANDGTANSNENGLVSITVNPVNDAPTFSGSNDPPAINEDAGAQSVTSFRTAVTPGPANEASQTPSFVITNVTHLALFAVQPAINVVAPGGPFPTTATLTYTPAPNANGTSVVTYHLHDNGGTANGGVDNSPDQTFTITVNAVNDAPVAAAKAFTVQANMKITGLTGLLSGVTDPDATNGANDSLSFDAQAGYTAPSVTLTSVTLGTCTNGSISNIQTNGTFDFDPPPGLSGGSTCVLQYQVTDTKNPAPGVASASQSITITAQGPAIWFVDPNRATDGNGTLSNTSAAVGAFNKLSSANAKLSTLGTNQKVFVYSGTTASVAGEVLDLAANNDWLVGQGTVSGSQSFTVVTTLAGAINNITTSVAVTDATSIQPGDFIQIDSEQMDVVSKTSNTLTVTRGFSSTSAALHNNGANVSVSSSVPFDTFLGISPPAGTITRPALTANTTTAKGLRPTVSGTVTMRNVTQVTGVNIVVTGANKGLTSAGFSSGTSLIKDVSVTSATGNAVDLSGTQTVTYETSDGANSPNVLNAVGGIALNVFSGVTIGANGFTFKSISANGGTNGIVLNNTGATAGLTVTGTGTTAGSGGTIQNCSAKGADIRSATNISLSNMNFTNNATANLAASGTCGDALNGTNGPTNCNANIAMSSVTTATLTNVTATGSKQIGIDVKGGSNLTLTNMTVTGNGNETMEDGVQITDLTGTLTVAGGLFKDNAANQFEVQNGVTGPLSVIVGTSTFSNTAFPTGATTPSNTTANSGLFLATHNTAVMNPTITNNAVDRIYAQGIRLDMAGSSGMTANIGPASGAGNGNTITNSNQAISLTGSATGTVNYNIRNNNASIVPANVAGGATNQIGVARSTASGTWTGLIENNTVGTSGTTNSGCQVAGCDGIDVVNNSAGTHKLSILGNTIRETEGSGMVIIAGGAPDNSNVSWIVKNNTISNPEENAGQANPAILIQSGTSVGTDTTKTCLEISGNTITGTWSLGTGHLSSIRVRSLTTAAGSFSIVGFNPATEYPNDPTGVSGSTTGNVGNVGNVADYIRQQNPGVSNASPGQNAASATQGAAVFSNSGGCPLLLAEGGVDAALKSPSLISSVFAALDSTFVGETPLAPATVASPVALSLSQPELDATVAAAIQRWSATGLAADQIASLREIKFEVTELSDSYLGEANGNRVLVDATAQHKGWFVDGSPASDGSFARVVSATRRYTDPEAMPAGHIDLLTAIEHEMGHKLGLGDSYIQSDRDNLMYGYLTVGERRLPGKGQAANAIANNHVESHFLTLVSAEVDTLRLQSENLAVVSSQPSSPSEGFSMNMHFASEMSGERGVVAEIRGQKSKSRSRTSEVRDQSVRLNHAVKAEITGLKSEVGNHIAGVSLVVPTPVGSFPVNGTGAGQGFNLPDGKTITITFKATLNAPPQLSGPSNPKVTAQATLTGSFVGNPLLSDDPVPAGTADPTSTNVDLYDSTTTLGAVPSAGSWNVGQSVTFTATIGTSGTPDGSATSRTGTVVFKDNGTPIAACNGATGVTVSSNTAQCAVVFGSGAHSVQAFYSGDGNFDPSTSSALSQAGVNPSATTTGVVSSTAPNPSLVTQSVTFTATVSSNTGFAGPPTGTADFYDGTVTPAHLISGCSARPLNGSAQATCTTSALDNAGSPHTINAVYSGDSNFLTSTGSTSQTVNKSGTNTALITSGSPSSPAQQVTYTATVTSQTAVTGPFTGSVTFKDGATNITGSCEAGSQSLTVGGAASCKITYANTSGSPHSITAVYSGDTTFITSTSSPLTQTVNANASTTTLVSSQNPSAPADPLTFTATISPSSATGTVDFKDNNAAIIPACTGVAVAGGSAQCSTPANTFGNGTHPITAVYSGDLVVSGSTSNTISQVVSSCANPFVVTTEADDGSAGTLRSGINGGVCPGGTITFAPAVHTISLADSINNRLVIGSNMTIAGPGSGQLTVKRVSGATNNFRVFEVGAFTVTISGMTISNGNVVGPTGGFGSGGGISNAGTLTLSDVIVSGNFATGGAGANGGAGTGGTGGIGQGGGIFNGNTLTLNNSTVSGNTATGGQGGGATGTNGNGGDGQGGGIYNTGTLTLNNTSVNGTNAATRGVIGVGGTGGTPGSGFGGGLYNDATGSPDAVTIFNSTISGNNASTNGGGIANVGLLSNATLAIFDSTISGNMANNDGGGLYNDSVSGTTTITSSTITNNHADNDASAAGTGGGIRVVSGPVTLTNTIVAANFATSLQVETATVLGGPITSGVRQVETITVSGAPVTNNGNILVRVTAAGMTNSPKTVSVPVVAATDTTNAAVATKIQTALQADTDVNNFFTVTTNSADVILTAKFASTDDPSMHITIFGSVTGIKNAESVHTTAGVAPVTGVKQVETATVVGTITGINQVETATVTTNSGSNGAMTVGGTFNVTVTAAGMTNSPKVVPVTVGAVDESGVATAIRAALVGDPDVGDVTTGFFTVSGTGASVVLTAKVQADNDATMNIAVGACAACTTLDTSATSANTKAGVAAGVRQVETATVTTNAGANGAMTVGGTFNVTVTAAGMNNSAKAVPVTVGAVDESGVATAIRAALAGDPDVGDVTTGFFTVSGTGASVVLTAKAKAANDTTMNIAIGACGTCTTLDVSGTSANTTAGVARGSANATVTVTAAGMNNSPKTLNVAVLADDDATAVALKMRTALSADPDITNAVTGFAVSGATDQIVLTKNTAAADDTSLNIATDNGTCAGLTPEPTSANTTAGVAPVAAVQQVETITVTGAPVIQDGSILVIVTAAVMGGNSPKTVTVPLTVAADTTNDLVATHIATALNSDPNVGTSFTATHSSGNVVLTANTAAADDPTLHISIRSATGINSTESVHTTGGGSAGSATIAITAAAGITGNPKTINVPVNKDDTASDVGGKMRAALIADAEVNTRFMVSGAGAQIVLTRRVVEANDATLNIAIGTGTATGLTAAPTSNDTKMGGTATPDDISGTVIGSSSFNLVGVDTGLSGIINGANQNQVGTVAAPIDPKLDPLSNNGGSTQTHKLQSGSPALEKGTNSAAAAALTTLNGGIDSVTTSIIVTSAANVPAGATILIDTEQILVNSKTGNTLTVTRHVNGSAANPHADTTPVFDAFDQRGFARTANFDSTPPVAPYDDTDIGAYEQQTAPPKPDKPVLTSTNSADPAVVGGVQTSDGTPDFNITGVSPGATVELLRNGVPTTPPTTGVAVGNSIALTDNTLPGDGTYLYSARQTVGSDVSATSDALSVKVDATSPAQPSTPVLAAGSDSGTAGDNKTNVTTPTFTGTAEANSTILLFDNGVQVGTGATDNLGSYSVTSGVALTPDGLHPMTVKAKDAIGNISIASGTLNLIIDTQVAAPSAPDLITADDTFGVGTTGTNTDNNTKVNTPTFTGTAEPNSTVTLYADGNAVGTPFVATGGNWSIQSSLLADGPHNMTAKAVDEAGNVSVASSALPIVIDTASTPATPDLQAASDSFGAGTTGTNSDDRTKTTPRSFDITGTENNALVELLRNDASLAPPVTTTGNGATVTLTDPNALADGAYTYKVKQTDIAGNVGISTVALSVTIDTTADTPGTPDLQTLSDTGTDSTDNRTGNATHNFDISGTVAGNFVELLRDGTVVSSTQATGTSVTLQDTTSLVDGVYHYTARQTDVAGNGPTLSLGTLDVTIDTTAPVVVSDTRANANPTSAASVDFTVVFSEPVTGVDIGDFTATASGGLTLPTTPPPNPVTNVVGSGTTYTVTVNTGSGDGSVRLDVISDGTIKDVMNLPFTSTFTTGEVYTVDRSNPTVTSITRAGPDPTGAASVDFTVTFSETVTGVDNSDFTLTTTGAVAGASVNTVTGSGSTRTVNVLTGTGNGTIKLNLVDDDTIIDVVSKPLGGAGAGNGSFATGQAYTIDKTAPTVTVEQVTDPVTGPKATTIIHFTATFSKPVTGLTNSGVTLSGTAGATTANVSGSGAIYDIAVNGMTQGGTVIASLQANAATDNAGNGNQASTSVDNTVTFIVDDFTTFEVNSLADPGSGGCTAVGVGDGCTLREAIAAANADGGAETITFAPALTSGGPAVIKLSTALPDLSTDMTIQGPGANLLTVMRSDVGVIPRFRVFTVSAGTVGISGLTISNGATASGVAGGPGTDGGGISNAGTLTLSAVTITGNAAGSGGNGGGSPGGSGGFGGGVFNNGTLAISNSTINANNAGTGGDGVTGGTGGSGGGIYHTGAGTLTITNSTISGNQTGVGGSPAGTAGSGGGIGTAATLTLTSSTVTANTATGSGGGLSRTAGVTTIQNSIIGGNSGLVSAPDISGTVQSDGFNLIQSTSGATINQNGGAGPDITGQDPLLNPLADNGGPTFTHSLQCSSPALDKGKAFGLTTDQRGGTRPFDFADAVYPNAVGGDGSDIGAVETQSAGGCVPTAIPPAVQPTTTSEDTPVVITLTGTYSQNTNLTFSITQSPANGALGPISSPNCNFNLSMTCTATVTYTPSPNASGADLFKFKVSASGLDSDPADVTVSVSSVNDPPTFGITSDSTVNEDAGPQAINNFAFNISPGAANESSQVLQFIVTNNTNTGLFSAGPAIDATGTLAYTSAPNANGQATITVVLKDDGGTANGGNDTSTPKTFTITVNSVNDAPSFTVPGSHTVLEDAGPQTVANFATAISVGPPQESAQTAQFIITNNTNAGMFSSVPAISPTGTLTYTPAPDANGSATITVVLKDNGGTLNGGVDTSAPQTFTINVTAVNDAPTLDLLADRTINEDAPTQTVSLAGITAGGGEVQVLTVTATSNNPALIPNPTVNYTSPSTTGSITFTPVADQNGTAIITVTVNDGGGTANGGVQTITRTFNVTVNAVNDAPINNLPGPQTIVENSPLTFSTANANLISITDVDSAASPLRVTLTATNGVITLSTVAGLAFSVGDGTADPTMTFTGTLASINTALQGMTFTPTNGFSGAAALQIITNDQGNTGIGGPLSDTDTLSITVNDGGTLQFSAATYSVSENAGPAVITITRTGASAGTATVQIATSNGTATAGSDYTAVSQTVTFNTGETSKTVNIPITDDSLNEPDETVNLTLSNVGGSGALGTPSTAVLTIANDDPAGGYIKFSSPTYTVAEGGVATITVQRTGTLTQAVTVNFATSDDSDPASMVLCAPAPGNTLASSRCDFTSAFGRITFAAGDGADKTFKVLTTQDSYVEGPETFTVTLSSPTNSATLALPSTAIVTITDDAVEPPTNTVDDSNAFVEQLYRDFLNRPSDPAGKAFWVNNIDHCNDPAQRPPGQSQAQCIQLSRIVTAAAFFLSIEFQATGGTAYLTNKAAFGSRPNFARFEQDAQQIGLNYVFGQPGAEALLEANKVAYFNDYVTRTDFVNTYGGVSDPTYVNTLIGNTGVTFTQAEHDAFVNGLANQSETRATVLRKISEKATFRAAEFNSMFVLMEYYGFLRRNPDTAGFNFWLNKLNIFNGNYLDAEMVKAFIESAEYRQRFGP